MSLASRDLDYFLEIAHCGQLARAASNLELTPAALSKSIRRLESEVGLRLFERTGEGLRLTSFGVTFREYALRIKAQNDEALRHAAELQKGSVGLLRIGTTIAMLETLVAPALALLQPRRPAMRAQVSVAASDEVLQRLRQAQVDLAVVPTYDEFPEGLTHSDIGVDFFAPVVREGHPFLAAGKAPTLADLSRHGWILPASRSPARAKFEAVFRRAGLEPPVPAIEVSISSALTLSIVGATDLISFVPELAAGRGAFRIRTLPISDLVLQRTLSLFRRPDSYTSPLMEEIMEMLRQSARRGYAG